MAIMALPEVGSYCVAKITGDGSQYKGEGLAWFSTKAEADAFALQQLNYVEGTIFVVSKILDKFEVKHTVVRSV